MKVHGSPGYVIKDMGGLQGIGKVLSMLGKALPLVLPEPQGSPDPLVFEVVYNPFVAVRTGPSKTRPIQVPWMWEKKVLSVSKLEAMGFIGLL